MLDPTLVSPRWRTADDARRDGWSVAIHNDYRLQGKAHTFWLVTHPCGLWAKGEGRTDDDALYGAYLEAQTRMQQRSDEIDERRNLRSENAALKRALGDAP